MCGRGGLGSDDCLSKPGRGHSCCTVYEPVVSHTCSLESNWVFAYAVKVEVVIGGDLGTVCCRSAGLHPAICS